MERIRRREMTYTQKSTTVFVDNIPHQTRKIWVYNLFARYGIIRDLFIPNKRSKITGQDFGFVRFYKIKDAMDAIVEVNNTWRWGNKLTVKFASFLRKIDVQGSLRSYNNVEKQTFSHPKAWRKKGMEAVSDKTRGKEVWRRKGITESSDQGKQRNSITLNLGNLESPNFSNAGSIIAQSTGNDWLIRSAVAKIRKLVSCKDLEYVFRSNGVQEIQIRAIGGRNVILTFQDKVSRDSIINQSWLVNWFEHINPWNGEHAQEERFVWLSCFGMPLNAWSYPTFKDIGNKWGQFLMVDEETMKETSFVKAKILIATDQVQIIKGHMELVVEKIKYHVRILEEESFRSIENSFFPVSHDLEIKDAQTKVDVMEPQCRETEKITETEVNNEAKQDEVAKQSDLLAIDEVGNPINSLKKSAHFNENAAAIVEDLSSSLGVDTSAMGNEKTMGSSNFDQSHTRAVIPSDEASTNIIMETQDVGNEVLIAENNKITNADDAFYDENIEIVDATLNDVGCNQLVCFEKETNLDSLDYIQAPIQSAVKGQQGKKKRKTINDILGYSKVKPGRGGGRNKNKSVILRSTIAAAALSASISSEGINNRNRILLDEAQAIWAINKMHGINYDGDEQEVVSKIAELEANVMGKADCHI